MEGGMTASLEDQIVCVQREIRMRERNYPKWVENGRMTQAQSDKQLGTMRDVLETLKKITPEQLTLGEIRLESIIG